MIFAWFTFFESIFLSLFIDGFKSTAAMLTKDFKPVANWFLVLTVKIRFKFFIQNLQFYFKVLTNFSSFPDRTLEILNPPDRHEIQFALQTSKKCENWSIFQCHLSSKAARIDNVQKTSRQWTQNLTVIHSWRFNLNFFSPKASLAITWHRVDHHQRLIENFPLLFHQQEAWVSFAEFK